MVYTWMVEQHRIDVNLREFDKTHTDECTFVFVPRLTARSAPTQYLPRPLWFIQDMVLPIDNLGFTHCNVPH